MDLKKKTKLIFSIHSFTKEPISLIDFGTIIYASGHRIEGSLIFK